MTHPRIHTWNGGPGQVGRWEHWRLRVRGFWRVGLGGLRKGHLQGLCPLDTCLPQVPNLLEPVRAGVAGSELGVERGPGLGGSGRSTSC